MLFSTVGGFSILFLLIYVCISFPPKYFHLSSPGVSAVLQLTLRIIRVLQLRVRDEGCFLRWEVKYISRSGSGSPYLANTNYAVCFQPRWKLCWLKNWEFWAVNAAFIHLFSYFLFFLTQVWILRTQTLGGYRELHREQQPGGEHGDDDNYDVDETVMMMC